jgi:hypothetical protein
MCIAIAIAIAITITIAIRVHSGHISPAAARCLYGATAAGDARLHHCLTPLSATPNCISASMVPDDHRRAIG